MTEDRTIIGPPKVTFLRFLMKLGAGVGGGLAGSLILLVVFLLSASVLQPALDPTSEAAINPLFIFVLMMMMFLATCGANIIGTLLLALTERERYTRLSSSLYQIFIVNIVIFGLTAPLYFVTANMGIGMTAYAAGFHIVMSAQASALILEMISDPKYSLLGVYSTLFAILFSAGVLFLIFQATGSATTLLFAVFPIIWMSIGFMGGLIGMIYHGIYATWGIDFLAGNTNFGDDYGEQKTEEEEQAEQEESTRKDQAGSEFLRDE
jgi:hypothetical protein